LFTLERDIQLLLFKRRTKNGFTGFYMVRINVSGIKDLQKRLAAAPDKVKRQASEAVQIAGRTYAKLAKQSASAQFGDFGIVAGGIQSTQLSPLQANVSSNANYSAYFEWGTITHVVVPADLQDYAIQFKGLGIRKTGGIIPRPYFFIHQPVVQKMLISDMIQILEGI
jgi:hypothetical protein